MSRSSVRTTSAVQKAVDGDGRHPVTYPELDAGQQVAVEGVDPSGAQQPDQVERPARLPEAGAELYQRGKLIEFT